MKGWTTSSWLEFTLLGEQEIVDFSATLALDDLTYWFIERLNYSFNIVHTVCKHCLDLSLVFVGCQLVSGHQVI